MSKIDTMYTATFEACGRTFWKPTAKSALILEEIDVDPETSRGLMQYLFALSVKPQDLSTKDWDKRFDQFICNLPLGDLYQFKNAVEREFRDIDAVKVEAGEDGKKK